MMSSNSTSRTLLALPPSSLPDAQKVAAPPGHPLLDDDENFQGFIASYEDKNHRFFDGDDVSDGCCCVGTYFECDVRTRDGCVAFPRTMLLVSRCRRVFYMPRMDCRIIIRDSISTSCPGRRPSANSPSSTGITRTSTKNTGRASPSRRDTPR
jgi:hypothetical protein